MAQPGTDLARPRRAPFREHPVNEALAIDRRFLDRPGAFGLIFDVPEPIAFDPETVGPDGIAVLCIEGPLEHHACCWWANYEDIAAQLACALECPAVKAVALKIDSPGGVAAGMGQAHRAIRSLRAKSGKTVCAYVSEQACSAAYNLASACQEIWLPREGVVGSVGVILCTVDETAALDKAGVAVRYVVTGARKADLHPGAPVTDEVLKVAQQKVDEMGGHFFRAVARARRTTPEAIAGLEAAVFCGENAVSVGLADKVADWPEFLDTLRSALGASVGPTSAALSAAA